MDHDEPPKRDRECYTGERTVAFSAVILGGDEVFTRPEVVLPHVEYLIRAAGRFHCVVPIYCFLPSQFRAVFRGTQPDAQLLGAMNYFKHLSGMWLRAHDLGGWERGYTDQVLDSEEAWRAHAAVIAHAPVCAGLVDDWSQYPFTGSLEFDLPEIVS